MDPNGTRFHLITGEGDWRRGREEGGEGDWLRLHWDGALTLHPLLPLFPRGRRDASLDPAARRGAAVDRFGTWYWIGHDRRRIYWKPRHATRPSVYWDQTPAAPSATAGDFRPRQPEAPAISDLAGLTVTAHHYLVVGDVTGHGVVLFDLHAGGEPVRLVFPRDLPFEPFDMASAPDGGVWILDRANRTYWGLDRQFRVVTVPWLMHETAPAETAGFRPVGGDPVVLPGRSAPAGFPTAATDPLAIEGLPDGSVLILDSPAVAPSVLLHYRLGTRISPPLALEDDVETLAEGQAVVRTHLSVAAHDLVYVPDAERPAERPGTLFVVERDGNQSIAFTLDLAPGASQALAVKADYLPMHAFGARALAREGDTVFYDVVGGDPANDAAVRWIPLHAIDQPRYQRHGVLVTPVLDGKERDCVWHRCFADACIPVESAVRVWSRAHNDPALLPSLPFDEEPPLYLRAHGAEIPFYQPFADRDVKPERTGTWELLFQRARGRYLEVRLELTGNGRVSPRVTTLRIHYPRFSYPRRYLPAVYLEDADSADFLERLLANPEGFYTEIEAWMRDARVLFDGRTAPRETLDWLAGWLGIVLDPLWARIQERRSAETGRGRGAALDRRRLFIRFVRTLYEERGTTHGVRFALHLLLDPCLEATLARLKTAAVHTDRRLRAELAPLGLPYPTPGLREERLEDLLHDLLLAPGPASKVRIVERFLARGERALAVGDVARAGSAPPGVLTPEAIAATAHRFSVLVPERLSDEEAAMVERIVRLERPAHTDFDVRRYSDGFRVGEARVGLDTVLGEDSRFVETEIGQSYLAEGYLAPPHPFDVGERVVADRDRIGELPPL
jgi:phage tail-like protein